MKRRTDLPERYQDLFIIDRSVYDCMDAFMALLMNASEFSLVPDLIGIFGAEQAVKFIDIFSGSTIKVPPRETLQMLVRDANVYTTLKKDMSQVNILANQYEVTDKVIKNIFDRVEGIIKENGNDG